MSDTNNQLVVERTFKVSKEKLYEAWTQANLVTQWMGPGEVRCKDASIDLKVGGQYRIHMVSDEGDHIVCGEYKEVVENERLQYTWGWEGGEVQNTLVTVTFFRDPSGSKIKILHEKFETQQAAEKHTFGWNGCIDKLEKFLEV